MKNCVIWESHWLRFIFIDHKKNIQESREFRMPRATYWLIDWLFTAFSLPYNDKDNKKQQKWPSGNI